MPADAYRTKRKWRDSTTQQNNRPFYFILCRDKWGTPVLSWEDLKSNRRQRQPLHVPGRCGELREQTFMWGTSWIHRVGVSSCQWVLNCEGGWKWNMAATCRRCYSVHMWIFSLLCKHQRRDPFDFMTHFSTFAGGYFKVLVKLVPQQARPPH